MTIKEYSFEKLTVWNEIRDLIRLIYSLTSIFPIEEKFGISNQMRRSAISIGSNLAEGSSKKSSKDQSRFYNISYSSLLELLSQTIVCKDLNYIDEEKYFAIRNSIQSISYKLNSLGNKATEKANIDNSNFK